MLLYPLILPTAIQRGCRLAKPTSTELNLLFNSLISSSVKSNAQTQMLCAMQVVIKQSKVRCYYYYYDTLFLASANSTVLVCLNPIWNCSKQDNRRLKIVCGCTAEGFWIVLTVSRLWDPSEMLTSRFIHHCQNDAVSMTKSSFSDLEVWI